MLTRRLCLAAAFAGVAFAPLGAAAGALDRIENVRDAPYLAQGNGSSDDRASIQAALNAAGCNSTTPILGTTGAVYLPAGIYLIRGSLSVQSPCAIFGSSNGKSILLQSTSNSDTLDIAMFATFNSEWRPVSVENLSFDRAPAATGGSSIRFANNPIQPTYSTGLRVVDVRFPAGMNYGLKIETASQFTVDRCYFNGSVDADVYVDNKLNTDVNDGTITNSFFFGSHASHSAIKHVGGGGLRVTNNKFLGYKFHLYQDFSLGQSQNHGTGILHFKNNSSEVPELGNVWFTASNPTVSTYYSTVLIQGNDFSTCGTNTGFAFCDETNPQGVIVVSHPDGTASTTTIELGVISGNTFVVNGGQRTNAIHFYQPPLSSATVQRWVINDNVITNFLNGITISASVKDLAVGTNTFINTANKVVDLSASSGTYMTLPSGNPPAAVTGEGYLYIEGGALKFKGGAGTVTVVASP